MTNGRIAGQRTELPASYPFLRFSSFASWRLVPFAMAAVVLIPVGIVLSSFLNPATDIWQHLVETVLAGLLVNTFWLVLGVALGTLVLGVGFAWLTAVCEFPGRRMFTWALLLPLAIPSYVTAFVFISLFDFTGPVQTALRDWIGPDLFWFPKARGRFGILTVMILALYPYVYLLARNAFLTQGKRVLEAGQSLGLNQVQGFFRVALPMARPWIASGVMLALMETLADFGTVAVFNYDTFTTAIYKAWFGMFSLSAASQLASVLIVIAFVTLIVEQQSRSRQRFHDTRLSPRMERIGLSGWRGWLACTLAAAVLIAGFVLPVGQLLVWSAGVVVQDFDQRYLGFLGHSLLLSGAAALITAAIALLVAYAGRRHHDPATRVTIRIATVGYALPGAVLAVGIFIPIAWVDRWVTGVAGGALGLQPGFLIQGTVLAMLVAYVARFLAVGHSPVDSAMHRITRSVDEAAMSLGLSGLRMLQRVHLPILRGGLLTAATLVFVDVMKEMPITLMTRPFGWDTLAVRIFELTSEGEWERAALPAVALVLAGLVPIILLVRQSEKA
ncbi:MAG: iron ABC transporter permease [Betaproteobacteria bacterium]|nr:iron ABC transporter permease [Betaproteobacteria bacterium]